MKLFCSTTHQLQCTVARLPTKSGVVGCQFSPNGSVILSSYSCGTIRLCQAATGEVLQTLYHSAFVRGCCFSPDGKTVLSAADDGMVAVWEVSTGEIINVIDTHAISPTCCCFSPDGKTILSCYMDGTMVLRGEDCIPFAPNVVA
jgi:WD40 repeat protein